MTGEDVRSQFLEFFAERGHEVVRSSPIVPQNDPSLLFTNAGMVQFKNVFLGHEKRPIARATSAQKCLRLSGKHNDLDAVGRDTYHHTFFEMLGNWSFGEYAKREAIRWAWELLTDVWKLPKASLWATVYRTDSESAELWRTETDVDPMQILRFDEKDNFWEMGDTGPCGPCSEIHIDRGAEACDQKQDKRHRCEVNAGCARFIELWNLVFIQHDRHSDGSLSDLDSHHVDTGMGLERITAVLQDVPSNYDTDLLRDLIRFTEEQSGRRYGDRAEDDLAMRVIADHSRALSFMIADGVAPANDGRGYVLRRILRRAARHAKILGFDEPYLHRMTAPLANLMGAAYPELLEHRPHIEEVIRGEEDRFAETLSKGLALLEQERRALARSSSGVLSGEIAFRLYDTYGFPLDMTEDILRNDGFTVDTNAFATCMEAQRDRARGARKTGVEVIIVPNDTTSRFVGDRSYEHESEILAIVGEGEATEARAGEAVSVVTAETPFYGESGGQVGDHGTIETSDGSLLEITDCQRPRPNLIVHIGKVVRGRVAPGDRVTLRVDRQRRDATRLNHSATHLLHAALRRVLGEHVRQAGSLVDAAHLRFDFSQPAALDAAVLTRIEDDVNTHIRANVEVSTAEMPFDEAVAAGALAFFGDKYGDRVRVVRMGDFSTELCGGTHVERTGDIGVFQLHAESGVAAGTRRIEAVTGSGALASIRQRDLSLKRLGSLLRSSDDEVVDRVERLLEQQKKLEQQLGELQRKATGAQSTDLLAQAQEVRGKRVIASEVAVTDARGMLEMADQLRERLGSGVVILASRQDGRVRLLAAVTKDLTAEVHAGKIIREIASMLGGKGGGKADLAQGAGNDVTQIAAALEKAVQLVP